MKLFPKNLLALTFVETIIYVALVSLVVLGFLEFAFSISNSRNKVYAYQEVQANGRAAVEIISQNIRQAVGINFASSTFLSDPGVLNLISSDPLKNPVIISLTENNGRLQIVEGNLSPAFITSHYIKVSNLSFTNLTNNSKQKNIMVNLTLNYDNPGNDQYFNASQSWQFNVNTRK